VSDHREEQLRIIAITPPSVPIVAVEHNVNPAELGWSRVYVTERSDGTYYLVPTELGRFVEDAMRHCLAVYASPDLSITLHTEGT